MIVVPIQEGVDDFGEHETPVGENVHGQDRYEYIVGSLEIDITGAGAENELVVTISKWGISQWDYNG